MEDVYCGGPVGRAWQGQGQGQAREGRTAEAAAPARRGVLHQLIAPGAYLAYYY